MKVENGPNWLQAEVRTTEPSRQNEMAALPFAVEALLVAPGMSLSDALGDALDSHVERSRILRPNIVASSMGEAQSGDGGEVPARVVFFAQGEDVQLASSAASTVIAAQVIGDELLALKGGGQDSKIAGDRPAQKLVTVEMLSNDDGQVARVKIQHRTLGPVSLRVELRNDQVEVVVDLASPSATRLILASEQGLREALRGQNLRLQKLVVGANRNKKRAHSRSSSALHEEA